MAKGSKINFGMVDLEKELEKVPVKLIRWVSQSVCQSVNWCLMALSAQTVYIMP